MSDNFELREGERLDDLQLDGMKIIQHMDAFRFGTDAVVLADFAKPRRGECAVDMGTGTGAIALLMAGHQQTLTVDALEIQPMLADMAARSVAFNRLEERVCVHRADMREAADFLGHGRYTLAVCNPPYGRAGGTLVSRGEAERVAKHECDLTPQEVCKSASALLKNGGRFCVIYPAPRAFEMMQCMENAHMQPKRIRTIHGVAGRAPKLVLLEAIKGARPSLHWLEPLVLRNEDGSYTPEWHRIYDTAGENDPKTIKV